MLAGAAVDGVVKVSELAKLGMSTSTIAHRCEPGGPWRRLLPGIVVMSSGYPTARQRTVASLVFAGPGAMLTGRSAMVEHGFGEHVGDVHVLLPDRRRVQSTSFVMAERTTRLPMPVVRNGLPCAPVPRALLDGARRMTTLDTTRAVIAEVVQRGTVSVEDLVQELREGSIRGSALPRAVLDEVAANVHSVPEAKARALWLRSGLPPMTFNCDVTDEAGQFIARPDGWIDSVAMAWEINSLAWHLSPDSYRATVERRNRMQSAGIIVFETLPSAFADEEEVLRGLVKHHELARSRPRPTVRVRR